MPVSWAEWVESVQAAWEGEGVRMALNVLYGALPSCAQQTRSSWEGVCWRGTGWREGLPQALSSAHLGAVPLRMCRQADTVTAPG